MTTHVMFDGRLQLYRRVESKVWQCATRIDGVRHRSSTGEEDVDLAREVAELWYMTLRVQARGGVLPVGQAQASPQPKRNEKTFGEAAELYLKDVRVLAVGTRSPKYIEFMELRMKRHVLPYFGKMPLSAVNKGAVQAYRVKRAEETIALTATETSPGKPPARSTMLQEIVHIRQVLKHAESMGWISVVPNLSTPYMSQRKRERRAWFSPDEYKQLYTATRKKAAACKHGRSKQYYEEIHDFVLLMANTGLRPDEAKRLEFRDVVIEDDPATGEPILVIDVRGKTGVGYCKSMPGAVHPFNRLKERRAAEAEQKRKNHTPRELLPTDLVFRKYDRELFNGILREEGLKLDRDGRTRTAYSLRHTYISMRLMEGANIHQIANNCRTSVQMIEQFYAAHIKDRLDTSLINVQRPKAAGKRETKPRPRRGRPKQNNDLSP